MRRNARQAAWVRSSSANLRAGCCTPAMSCLYSVIVPIVGDMRSLCPRAWTRITNLRGKRYPVAKEARVTSARLSCSSGLGLDGVQAKRTFLQLPDRMPLEHWLHIGEQISVISDASAWWIGDWLAYGEHAYPDRYREAMTRSSLQYQTLRNYAWVARKFPASRRRDSLSFQHHFEVASLPEADQDLWLQRAKQFGWSKTELRRRIKARNARGDALGDDLPADRGQRPLTVAPDQAQVARWERAATQAGMSLPDWVVVALDRAAEAMLIMDASLVG
jgi:hypothetical protein